MKINKADFLSLKELITSKTLNEGKIKNKEIIKSLALNGAITIIRKTAKRKILSVVKEENIFLFLRNQNYFINSIEEIDSYIEDILESDASRDSIQKYRGDTKLENSPSLKGLYISAPSDIDIFLDRKEIALSPQNGMGYFFFYTQKVSVEKTTVIVGVENYQVIWFAQKYRNLFDTDVVFVMINPYMLEWLEDKENEYIHFGDYDLAGINIYQNRVVPHLKKSQKHSFFIPYNIEEMIIKMGNRELYEKQSQYNNMPIEDNALQKLQTIILKYKKVLEQEIIYELT